MVSTGNNALRILVIDDEPDILDLLEYNLTKEGYLVTACDSSENGYRMLKKEHIDLVILDLMLPGMSGLDLCRLLKEKKKTADIPLIMLTAKGTEEDIIMGLELGADDYVIKPFSLSVLLARVKAVLKRCISGTNNTIIKLHSVVLDKSKREVQVNGQTVNLTFTEFEILQLLISRPGWVFTRGQIVDRVRGDDYPVTERSVDVHLFGLRKKLGTAGNLIETIRGVGYKFIE